MFGADVHCGRVIPVVVALFACNRTADVERHTIPVRSMASVKNLEGC